MSSIRSMIPLLCAVLIPGAALAGGLVDPVVDVQLTQLDWLDVDGDVLYPHTRVATAEFTVVDGADAFIGERGGMFVNLVTDAGEGPDWSVQNLLLVFRDEGDLRGSQPTVQFRLPVAGPVDELNVGWTLSSEPQDVMPLVPIAPLPVGHRGYHAGGRGGAGGSARAAFPMLIGPWIHPPPVPLLPINRISTVLVPVADIPAINEDPNGCAPASVARSLGYLGDLFELDFGEPQAAYDLLYLFMGTDPRSGTSDGDMFDGKVAYTELGDLPIDTRWSEWADGMNPVMDSLDAGGDVEVLITWDEPDEDDWEEWLDEMLEDLEKRGGALGAAADVDPTVEETLDAILAAQDAAQEALDAAVADIMGHPRSPRPSVIRRSLERYRAGDPPADPEAADLLEALDEALNGKKESEEDEDQFWDDLFDSLYGEGPPGHAAMVTRVVAMADGTFLVTFVDDPDQHDGEAENEEHTVVVQPDGTFPGGRIDRFLLEHIVL